MFCTHAHCMPCVLIYGGVTVSSHEYPVTVGFPMAPAVAAQVFGE